MDHVQDRSRKKHEMLGHQVMLAYLLIITEGYRIRSRRACVDRSTTTRPFFRCLPAEATTSITQEAYYGLGRPSTAERSFDRSRNERR